jgi:glycosyltransferase involved in cell wall biosynthesis
MSNNLLQLVMIVKDASVSIRETLESYKPIIGYWSILDTGSTDDTREIIKEVLVNIPGQLHEHPFEGFSESRNRALDLAGTTCVYNIMPDDTYILHGQEKLLKLLNIANTKYPEKDVISIKISGFDCDYFSDRISRSASKIRYTGVIHEVLSYRESCLKLEESDVFMEDKLFPGMYERSFARWHNDLEVLLKKHAEEPDNTRWIFYVAMTYYALHNPEKAIEYFEKRIKYDDGHNEEKFLSCMNIGILKYQKYKTIFDSSNYFLGAIKIFPTRAAEALYHLAECYSNDVKEISNKIVKEFPEITHTVPGVFSGTIDSSEKFMERKLTLDQYKTECIISANMYYSLIKEASSYPEPADFTLFTEVDLYRRRIPKECIVEAVKRNDFQVAIKEINKLNNSNTTDNETKWFVQEMTSLINTKKNNSKEITKTIIKSNNKCVFVTGSYYYSWNGLTKKLGGSETMLKNYAEYVASKGLNVYAFVDCKGKDQITVNGVHYRSYMDFAEFVSENEIEYCIISRSPDFLNHVNYKKHIHKVFFWVHDIFPCGTPVCDPNNFKKFILLSKWHVEINKKEYGIPDNLISIIDNCIDIERFKRKEKIEKIKKIPNTFCYTSWFNRGLVKLLEIAPYIKKRIPDAMFYIYCDIPPHETEMINTVKKNSEYIKLVGRVSQEILAESLLDMEYWIYPAIFNETFCISAIEAQAAKCICIYTDIGALGTTIGDRGIRLNSIITHDDLEREKEYDPVNRTACQLMIKNILQKCSMSDVANDICNKIEIIKNDPILREDMLERGRKYAEEHDINIVGEKLYKLINN